jgi:hypothetical protein
MRSTSVPASSFARFVRIAAPAIVIACGDSTAPPAQATHLAFLIQPGTSTASTPIAPAVSVVILDDANNRVTTADNSVTLSLGTNPLSGTLGGTVTVAAVSGVATFSSLSVNVATTGYTLSATSPGLTAATSLPFSVAPGLPIKLGFLVQPTSTIARTAIPTFSVAVQDADGNTVPTAAFIIVQIGINPGAGVLSGQAGVATVNGVATFSAVAISKPGTGYTLVARATSFPNATSAVFNLTVGAASKLAFTQVTVASRPGAVMTPPAVVEVQDAAGNTISTATSITLGIGTNPGNGTLSGTTTVNAVNGVATFSDLSINNSGTGYTLTAAAASLTGTTSRAFSVRNALAFAKVTAGYFHTCGVTTGGDGYCWGDNSTGQLGVAVAGWTSANAPLRVSGQIFFVNLIAGRNHTCGASNNSAAYCWGFNADGRVGVAPPDTRDSPTAVSGGLAFSLAGAGYAHSCGVTTAGAAYCWGDNQLGALGNNTLTPSSAPVAVAGGLTFVSIGPGRLFTCGVTSTAAPYCWGNNASGELGDGSLTQRTAPARVSTLLAFSTVSAGGFHACGLTTAGAAYCWGANDFGQLGNGSTIPSSVPVAVSGGITFATLSVGNRHNCGVTTTGTAYCWGDNSVGHLGNGTIDMATTPAAVSGGFTFTSVSAGRFHSCGVVTGGAAYCWGNNFSGELGAGTTVSTSFVPVAVR